jgi:hypothetical protein
MGLPSRAGPEIVEAPRSLFKQLRCVDGALAEEKSATSDSPQTARTKEERKPGAQPVESAIPSRKGSRG